MDFLAWPYLQKVKPVGLPLEGGLGGREGEKGDRGFFLRITLQRLLNDPERNPCLRLDTPQSFRRDVFLQEHLDAGVQRGAEGVERVGAIGLRDGSLGSAGGGGNDAGARLCHDQTCRCRLLHRTVEEVRARLIVSADRDGMSTTTVRGSWLWLYCKIILVS